VTGPGAGAGASVQVRGLEWTDFDPLVRIYYETYEERDLGQPIGITLFGERPNRSAEVNWFAGAYRRALAGEGVHLVAVVGPEVVGQCSIAGLGQAPGAEVAHVGELGILVDRRFRGQGVGTALLVAALEAARRQFETVKLSVFASNEGAQRLYRRVGFVEHGRLPRAIKRGDRYHDEVLMHVDLKVWRRPALGAKR
jgi:ribosomal protein S18 acetylase RimI-like enzyme